MKNGGIWEKHLIEAKIKFKKQMDFFLNRHFRTFRKPITLSKLSGMLKSFAYPWGLNPTMEIYLNLEQNPDKYVHFATRKLSEHIALKENWDQLEDIEQKKYLSLINGRIEQIEREIKSRKRNHLEKLSKRKLSALTEKVLNQSYSFFTNREKEKGNGEDSGSET